MKRILGYIIWILIGIAVVIGITLHVQDIKEREHLEHRANIVLPAMKTARVAHAYWAERAKTWEVYYSQEDYDKGLPPPNMPPPVDVPWWVVSPGQDAKWVVVYDEVIDILEEIGGCE